MPRRKQKERKSSEKKSTKSSIKSKRSIKKSKKGNKTKVLVKRNIYIIKVTRDYYRKISGVCKLEEKNYTITTDELGNVFTTIKHANDYIKEEMERKTEFTELKWNSVLIDDRLIFKSIIPQGYCESMED